MRGLAAGAALVCAGTASLAAERPTPRPEPPHLGACGTLTGGFTIPGTDACLTIGGFVQAESAWRLTPSTPVLAAPVIGAPSVAAVATGRLDRSVLGANARLTADLRMPTELGPVRVFVSLRGRNGAATDRASR